MPCTILNKTPQSLIPKLKMLNGVPVLIIGDLMLDEYLFGDVERISPEAPIPVVLIEKQQTLLGGAGNVARNIKALGGEPLLISSTGSGANSDKLAAQLKNDSLTARLLTLPGRPATVKTRVIARNQQMLRIDHEDNSLLTKTETEKLLHMIEEVWEQYRVIVISDYCKGLISKELMQGLQELKQRYPNPMQILVDPKVPNFHLYQKTDLITPNALETGASTGLPVRTPEEIIRAGQTILHKLSCQQVLTTLGANGMALFFSDDQAIHIPTAARKVFDVTGAGDTVIATIGLALSSGFTLLESCVLANYAAGIVVGEVGAATATQEGLAKAIAEWPVPQLGVWK